MTLNDTGIILPDFKKQPGAIVLDIDGTLLNSKSKLSVRNFNAINRCLAAGIPVVIATSRPARAVRRLLGMGLMNACSLVMQNGAIGIGNPPLSGQIKEVIPRKIVLDLIGAVKEMEPEIRITLELEGEAFGTNNPRDPESLWEINSATPDMQLTLEDALKGAVTKIAIGGLDREISHVANAILNRYGDSLSVVGEARKTFFNITGKTATKANTLRRLLKSKTISMESVLAIGDDLTDYDMLSACGMPVAMGNAAPEIKAICKYSTASNDEDGVAVVLERILEK